MDFNHTDDRQMLGDTLTRYLADRYPIDARNAAAYGDTGYSPDHWRALADLGITAALFGEDAGGFGGDGFDIMVVFEALGRGLVVEPFLGTLMAGTALAAAGGQDAVLARIASGAAIAAYADDGGTTVGDGRLSGRKAVVRHAEAADLIVVTTDDGALYLVERDAPGLTVRGYGTIDGGRAADLTFADTPATLVAQDGSAAIAAATDAGLLALSAEALGIMTVLRDQTLEYLRTRQQFGTVIGRFQALQHRMATVLLEIEQARSSVINAADAYGKPGGARSLAAAKYTAGHTGRLVAEEAIQLHGGIGMTWELPLSHYAKRLTMIDHQSGDEDHHLQRYIALGRTG